MGRKFSSHLGTANTAAYAASQPLFDAIRNASDLMEEHKQYLISARDTVKQLHVKLPSEHTGVERVTRADYIESLVKGWRLATNSYQLIFGELCKITAPDPATGREEQDDYETFKRMQEMALAANTTSFRYVIGKPKEKRKADSEESDLVSPKSAKKAKKEAEAEKKQAEVEKKQAEVEKKQAEAEKKIKEATTTNLMPPPKRPAPEGSSPTPSAPRPTKRARTTELDTTVTAKAAEPAKELSKRERRRHRNNEKANAQNGTTKQVPATLQPTTFTEPEPKSEVQYDDVSTEVNARLAAKEEKKRLKKEEKKRKRDSLGSAVIEAEVGEEKAALDARAKELAAKPAKKRSKSATGEAVRAGEVELPERGKRRGEHIGGDSSEGVKGEAAGESRKKRKKASRE